MSYLEIAKRAIRRVDQAPSRAANPANPDGEMSEISKISKGVPFKSEGSATANNDHPQKGDCTEQRVEHWNVRRIEIPSQTTPGHMDIWMIATDLSDEANWRLWFAGSEDSTHGSSKGEVDEPRA